LHLGISYLKTSVYAKDFRQNIRLVFISEMFIEKIVL
jgi:hypothetical protein